MDIFGRRGGDEVIEAVMIDVANDACNPAELVTRSFPVPFAHDLYCFDEWMRKVFAAWE